MKTTDLVNEVARLVAQKDLGLKAKSLPKTQDQVDLSDSAKAYAGHEAGTDYENEQNLKVGRLKSLVADGNYHMDQAMVETIAERIANMLI